MKLGGGGPLLVLPALAMALGMGACVQKVVLEQAVGSDGGATDLGSESGVFAGCPRLRSSSRVPDLLIALDRSQNMMEAFSAGLSRLAYVQQKLQDLMPYEAIVRLGYEEFPAQSRSCSGDCCIGDPLPVQAYNFTMLLDAMSMCRTMTSTCGVSQQIPIAQALNAAYESYAGIDNSDGHNRAVLLIVSDDPTSGCDTGSSSGPCTEAQTAASNLAGPIGVTTHVIGFGSGIQSATCLPRLVTQATGIYAATRTDDEFNTALSNVMQAVAAGACSFDLKPPSASANIDGSKIEVLLNGTPLAKKSDSNGWWDFPQQHNNTYIRLHGKACQDLIASGASPSNVVQVVQVDSTCNQAN